MIEYRECCFKTIPENSRKLVWEITHTCKFNCPYCFQTRKRLNDNLRVLNSSDLSAIIAKLKHLSVKDVLISGGEIWNVKDVLGNVCSELSKEKIPYSFSTTLYTDKEFIENLISLKPKAINISLDPLDEQHATQYNNDIKAAIAILDKTKENDIQVKITGVITKYNIRNIFTYFEDIHALLDKYESLSSIYVTNPYEIGYIKQGIRASYNELNGILEKINKLKNDPRIKMVNFHRFNMPLQQCKAGSNIIHIEPNGNLYPCHLFANLNSTSFLMGNILKDNIVEIKSKLDTFGKQAKGAIEDQKKLYAKCGSCKVQNKCGGGCIAELMSMGQLIELKLSCRRIKPVKFIKAIQSKSQRLLGLPSLNENDVTQEERSKIIEKIKNKIRQSKHDLAHGYDHIDCVVKLARFIAKREGGNLRIVTAAAYFHDFEPRQKLIFETHTEQSARKAVEILKEIGFTEEDCDKVYNCINTSSYGSSELGFAPESIEAKVVRDADWLDAIGARGIARVFAFAGSHEAETLGKCEKNWDPRNPIKFTMSRIGPDPSPIYHFFSKLLWIKNQIITNTGKNIAQIRHKRLVEFLENYKLEMNEETLLTKRAYFRRYLMSIKKSINKLVRKLQRLR